MKYSNIPSTLTSLLSEVDISEIKIKAFFETFLSLQKIKADFTDDCILEVGCDRDLLSSKYFIRKGAKRVVATNLYTGNITNSRSKIEVIAADVTKHDFDTTFNFIFGRAILEHIKDMSGFTKAIERILVPGGIAYFDGGPMWDSPFGSHCWLTAKSGTMFHFPTNNPLEAYEHLMYNQQELETVLLHRLGNAGDSREIAHFVFNSPSLNRLKSDEIIDAFQKTQLIVTSSKDQMCIVPFELSSIFSGSDHCFGRLILSVLKEKAI